jgi:hypothetical protein
VDWKESPGESLAMIAFRDLAQKEDLMKLDRPCSRPACRHPTRSSGCAGMTDRKFLPAVMLGALMTLVFAGLPAAAKTAQPSGTVRAACAADIRTLCAGIQPGGGRIRQCMREKRDQLSQGCKRALIAARDRSRR